MMKQKIKQSGSKPPMKLTAERKKMAAASVLIGVMVLMWARVLLKNNQVSAETLIVPAQTAASEVIKPKIKLNYIELPRIKGRNDVLSRDIFAGKKWETMGAAANGIAKFKHNENANEDLENTIEMIGKELKLEAVFSGKNPQASVSGTLVSLQSKLTVKYEGDQYEFKAVAINDNEVVLECKGIQVKLSMIKPNESAN